MSHLFYLVGPPAVGKLTVARELERRTGAIVVENAALVESLRSLAQRRAVRFVPVWLTADPASSPLASCDPTGLSGRS